MKRCAMSGASVLAVSVLVLAFFPSTCVLASWQTDGSPISTGPWTQYAPQIASDGAGGAIITWADNRNGDYDIYAQRVNASGTVQWAVNGVAVCTATGDQYFPEIVSDGAGGAIVTWEDYALYVHAQRVSSSGAVQWAAGGVILSKAAGSQQNSRIASDGAGGAIVAWEGYTGTNWDVFAQRVDASGTVQWTAAGVALCTATGDQEHPAVTPDGAGGAVFTWDDKRGNQNIYAQRVDASGAVQWPANGVALCAATLAQNYPTIVSDGAGGAIVTWQDQRNGDYDIYAQSVNVSGAVQWPANGVPLCVAALNQGSPTIASDGAGGAIVAWMDFRSGTDNHIYAQRVNASGVVQWAPDGVALCTATGDQELPHIVSDGVGGAIVAWMDRRVEDNDIYAQRVNASGAPLWTANGAAVCTAMGNQDFPAIISDGAGGAFLAWQDFRSANWDIFGMRVNAAGEPIATLLQCYSSSVSGHGIELTWTLAEMDADVRFIVLRGTQGASDFEQLSAEGLTREGLSFEFVDGDVESGVTYTYRVDMHMGDVRKTLFETGPIEMPASPVTLYQNSPNPFNPSTVIGYYVPVTSRITLDIFDSSGKLVVRLVDREERPRGEYAVEWHGVDAQGRAVGSGVYFYRLTGGKEVLSKKMVLLR
jgi:predicted lipoprotein with Yx(FWY)xxD motif